MAKHKTDISIEDELKVKEILAKRNIMLKDFAETIGITRESLTRALKGNPTYSTLRAIADGLGVEVGDLFKTKNEPVDSVRGYIEISGVIHKFNNREEVEELLKQIQP